LADLGPAAPACLWVRGAAALDRLCERSVALIGARACTAYGEHVTAELAAGLGDAGVSVVSGGAYGVDAVAHRTAVVGGTPTVAFLAGGVDRPYPAGNARLLGAIADGAGACVSEVPPGAVPSRTRFLQRNRLIAAAAQATVVVEAAWRSGALSTAGHAAALLRPVGAVPGPVTSAASAGCHRLLREGAAVCVTDAAEVLELVSASAEDGRARDGRAGEPPGDGRLALDGLDEAARRALDALPVRSGATLDALTGVAGLTLPELTAALGALELAGLAVQVSGRWRRVRPGDEAGRSRANRSKAGRRTGGSG
ncbi:DNA-protecting protein DprA, partial [Actinotalea ferrariae]|uniref:DNA-processing protein DprA n=1 Tax=Actinotalea ferrariae TaxID=1386098 RepID=UPI001C8B46B4